MTNLLFPYAAGDFVNSWLRTVWGWKSHYDENLVSVPGPSTSHGRPVHGCSLIGYLPPGLVSAEVLKQLLRADYSHLFRVAPVPLQSEVLQHESPQGCEGYVPMVPQEAAELEGTAV